jgi:hypothetical protein
MINLYREPSKDAPYHVSIHLAKRFQRRRFFLEINQSETRMGCGIHVPNITLLDRLLNDFQHKHVLKVPSFDSIGVCIFK